MGSKHKVPIRHVQKCGFSHQHYINQVCGGTHLQSQHLVESFANPRNEKD